jgi:hypothetical protein
MCVVYTVSYCTVSAQVVSTYILVTADVRGSDILQVGSTVVFEIHKRNFQGSNYNSEGSRLFSVHFLFHAMKTANICCLEPAVLYIIRRAHNHNNHFLANLLWRDSLFKR